MIWEYGALILVLMLVCAVVSLMLTDLVASAIVFGAYSFFMCVVWTSMGAVDVAFTEAAVGAGVSTVFVLAMLYNTARKMKSRPESTLWKGGAAFLVVLLGATLLFALPDFPDFGDVYSPANSYVSSHYLKHAVTDTHVPNIVTAVLADYRGFDTMLETAVVFIAAVGIFSLLRRRTNKKRLISRPLHVQSNSLIVRETARFLVPIMQLFALYVIAHGHYSPGGGFQGGVILGASLILLAMSHSLKDSMKRMREDVGMLLSGVGVLIFAGVGLVCYFLGENFLDYHILSQILPYTDEVMARSHAMLGVEIGVGLTVMCGMYFIYASLASDGHLDKGL